MITTPDTLPDEIDTLRAVLLAERAARQEDRARKLLDQLELQFEELETAVAEDAPSSMPENDGTAREAAGRKPVRAPLPAHLPRERVMIPGPTVCPCCGGALRKLGEDVTETLELIPRRSTPSHAAVPVRSCWPRCWTPSSGSTCR